MIEVHDNTSPKLDISWSVKQSRPSKSLVNEKLYTQYIKINENFKPFENLESYILNQ